MKLLKLFFQRTHFFWVSTRFIFIILFSWTGIEMMDFEKTSDVIISVIILLYTLFMAYLALIALLEKPPLVGTKNFVGAFSILYGLICALLLSQIPSSGFMTISLSLLSSWLILYGLWEFATIEKDLPKIKEITKLKIKYSLFAGFVFAIIMFSYLAITAKMDIAIFVSLFILLVSPFAFYWKIFSKIEFSGAFQKINRKQIVYSGMASVYKDGITVGGTLYLLSNRLIFQTNTINFFKRHELTISLNQIIEVELITTMGIINNDLLIKMENSNTKQFIVFDRKIWKQEIENQLQSQS